MKAIRLLAASMFLLTGVLHFHMAFSALDDPNLILTLAFGIVYFATGVLLLMNKGFARWMGLIPIVPLVMAPFMLDFQNMDFTFAWIPIEIVAVICCIVLLAKKSKG